MGNIIVGVARGGGNFSGPTFRKGSQYKGKFPEIPAARISPGCLCCISAELKIWFLAADLRCSMLAKLRELAQLDWNLPETPT